MSINFTSGRTSRKDTASCHADPHVTPFHSWTSINLSFSWTQDVINHSKNLRKKQGKEATVGDVGPAQSAGLKSLNKANRARLEAYQHLFYLLQVRLSTETGFCWIFSQSRAYAKWMKRMESQVQTWHVTACHYFVWLHSFSFCFSAKGKTLCVSVQQWFPTGSPFVILKGSRELIRFSIYIIKIAFSKCHQTLKQIAVDSPLGVFLFWSVP